MWNVSRQASMVLSAQMHHINVSTFNFLLIMNMMQQVMQTPNTDL